MSLSKPPSTSVRLSAGRTLIGVTSVTISTLFVAVVFASLYGRLWLPPRKTVSSVETKDSLRVMTFNTGLDVSNPKAIETVILKEGADIVVLQEVSVLLSEKLRNGSNNYYPHQVNTASETTVLLSRYPIIDHGWFKSDHSERATLYAKIEWQGELLHVFAVHPLPADVTFYSPDLPIPLGVSDVRPQQQIRAVKDYAQGLSGPVLLMGDFNMSEQAAVYQELTELFQDAYRQAGWGFGHTFPYRLQVEKLYIGTPLLRLDYIFHSDVLQTTQAHVGCGGGSDHCYVRADLVIIEH